VFPSLLLVLQHYPGYHFNALDFYLINDNMLPTMFAVIKTGGKQYKVQEGDTLSIEKLEHADNNVVFDQVLLWVKAKDIKVGKPLIPGAKVEAKVLEDGKGKKKMVFRYKNKTRRRKKKGHRQPYTKIQITKITA